MNSTPIEQYDAQGRLVQLYYSIAAAAKAMNVAYSTMYKTVYEHKRIRTYYFVEYGQPIQKTPDRIYRFERYDPNTNQLVGYYRSATEAQKELGISRDVIANLAKYHGIDKDGYCWRKLH